MFIHCLFLKVKINNGFSKYIPLVKQYKFINNVIKNRYKFQPINVRLSSNIKGI